MHYFSYKPDVSDTTGFRSLELTNFPTDQQINSIVAQDAITKVINAMTLVLFL